MCFRVIYMNGLTTHLYDLLTVLGRVHGRFCEEDLAVARVDIELLRTEGVIP